MPHKRMSLCAVVVVVALATAGSATDHIGVVAGRLLLGASTSRTILTGPPLSSAAASLVSAFAFADVLPSASTEMPRRFAVPTSAVWAACHYAVLRFLPRTAIHVGAALAVLDRINRCRFYEVGDDGEESRMALQAGDMLSVTLMSASMAYAGVAGAIMGAALPTMILENRAWRTVAVDDAGEDPDALPSDMTAEDQLHHSIRPILIDAYQILSSPSRTNLTGRVPRMQIELLNELIDSSNSSYSLNVRACQVFKMHFLQMTNVSLLDMPNNRFLSAMSLLSEAQLAQLLDAVRAMMPPAAASLQMSIGVPTDQNLYDATACTICLEPYLHNETVAPARFAGAHIPDRYLNYRRT
ncbi:unnamed protein product (mitochondrion) [Plasmodiophora brassicae]|uniref:Membrane-associated protein n=1 Tax=Plasmodiophora brassicae TaxID=37360 RepID=A0A3P3Y5B6_PLABS|nr:unnamed protein product [Plasmodiophora brassicae]